MPFATPHRGRTALHSKKHKLYCPVNSLSRHVPHNLYYKEDLILSACLFISAYKLMVGRT